MAEWSPEVGRRLLHDDVYEEMGKRHVKVLDKVLVGSPDLSGPDLTRAVLEVVAPDAAPDALEARYVLERWVRSRHGVMPSRARRRDGYWTEESQREVEMFRWAGLAIVMALVSGALVYWALSRRSESRQDSERQPPSTPPKAPPPPARAVVAMVAFSGKVRDGADPSVAADLLTKATHWWSGTDDDWARVQLVLGTKSVSNMPASDDALLVVAYEAMLDDAPPRSRPDASMVLRDLSRRERLRTVGIFDIGDPGQLSEAGFRR